MNDHEWFEAVYQASKLMGAVIRRKPPTTIEAIWHRLRLILFSQPPPKTKRREKRPC